MLYYKEGEGNLIVVESLSLRAGRMLRQLDRWQTIMVCDIFSWLLRVQGLSMKDADMRMEPLLRQEDENG